MFVPSTRRGPVRRLMRFFAWKAGEAAAEIISRVRGFHLPDDALQPYAQKIPMLLGFYESDARKVMRKMIRPGDIVIDGGAHGGYYTRLFARYAGPAGKVIAFEVHPDTTRLLRRNTAAFANVEIVGCALGASDGETQLFEQPSGSVGHSTAAFKPGLQASYTVPVRSLSSVLADFGLARFDFLKLDIEGTEPDVLASLRTMPELTDFSVLFEIKRYIIEAAGESPEALVRDLIDQGYAIVLEDGQEVAREGLAEHDPRFDKVNVLIMKGAAVDRWRN